MFRSPDCLLVRLGEIALKSPQVHRKMFRILLENMHTALEGIEHRFEINPKRIFVYTEELEKASGALQRVFGLSSISPVWKCHSDLDEMRLLAVDVAKQVLHLNQKKSFAIRARRSGRHKFTTQTVAEETGAAVKKVTHANVDLSNPDVEIFIETRSRNTYLFVEKIPCAGGLPLGTSGRALAIITNKQDAQAAWLIAKRGCALTLLIEPKAKKFIEQLRSWHIGAKIFKTAKEDFEKIADQEHLQAVVIGEKAKKEFLKKLYASKMLIFRPVFTISGELIKF